LHRERNINFGQVFETIWSQCPRQMQRCFTFSWDVIVNNAINGNLLRNHNCTIPLPTADATGQPPPRRTKLLLGSSWSGSVQVQLEGSDLCRRWRSAARATLRGCCAGGSLRMSPVTSTTAQSGHGSNTLFGALSIWDRYLERALASGQHMALCLVGTGFCLFYLLLMRRLADSFELHAYE
jgi:hypothetical protein